MTDTAKLVERLRMNRTESLYVDNIMDEAATRIEQLEAERDRLKEHVQELEATNAELLKGEVEDTKLALSLADRAEAAEAKQGELVEACTGLLRFLKVSVNAGPISNNPRMEARHLENIRLALSRYQEGQSNAS